MKLSSLRNALSVLIVTSHLGIIIYAIYLANFEFLDKSQGYEATLMVSPMLGGVALAAFTSVIERRKVTNKRVNLIYIYLAFLIPIISICIIFGALVAAHIAEITVHQLKMTIGFTETGLAAFIGVLSKALFGE